MVNSSAMDRLQAKHRQTSLELLVEISQGDDWELKMQVALWITAVSIVLRLSDITPLYIRKSCEAVETAKLQFIPTYGQPPGFTDELHEKLSVLSQVIYFENFLFLACGGTEPTMTARIEMEFRHQLRVRPTTSLFTSRIQHSLVGSISGIIQDMSVDHAHTNYLASQRHCVHPQPSSD